MVRFLVGRHADASRKGAVNNQPDDESIEGSHADLRCWWRSLHTLPVAERVAMLEPHEDDKGGLIIGAQLGVAARSSRARQSMLALQSSSGVVDEPIGQVGDEAATSTGHATSQCSCIPARSPRAGRRRWRVQRRLDGQRAAV